MTMQSNLTTKKTKLALLTGVMLISVVLNLFLVGVLAGGLPISKHKCFRPLALSSPHGEFMVGWISRYLEPDDASIFRQVTQIEATKLKEAHEKVHVAILNVSTVFEKEKPDPVALNAALDDLNHAKSEVNNVVAEIIQNTYSKLSVEGRHRLAELSR